MLFPMQDLSWLDLALLCHPVLALLPPRVYSKSQPAARRSWLALSFLALLAYRYYATPSPLPPFTTTTEPLCKTHDLPNPIAHLHPSNATGTLNGTITLLPIPLTVARSLIPPSYTILTHAYRALLPSFPADMYPAILQAVHDHDVQAFGYIIPDFSRAGIEFPFLDILGDGHTSFRWAPALLLSAGHSIAVGGAREYGTEVLESEFAPACDAYASVAGAPGATTFEAVAEAGAAYVRTRFEKAEGGVGLEFFRNVTNQPSFADGRSCDNMVRLFNTSVTQEIEVVRGSPKFSDGVTIPWPLV
ncbi:hypothetical protein C7974DRAFT_376024 [Boeremia exigua]|uniref:uncharacterized protein n=1 Tax=Boeremia exigua TaxID=749465 RepID=UPI001E8CB5AD|nr:uncharacterized protein C7974DRAFT_376024 [Boeremia exigua]KAH6629143.1 hypothetical protein C7974DRAFT_376024 [Boeremia exigua]